MILDDLQAVILGRKENPSPDSYVASLFEKGREEIMKKVGEEAIEVIVAASSRDRERTISELADLWFHSLVLMAEAGVDYREVLEELRRRFGKKGGRE